MNTKNNVLVLLSTYNGEKYLKQQIDSLLNQININLNVLIRDDGSTDNTVKILREYADKNNCIEFYNEENVGYAKSFWNLIHKAATEYDFYAFCDQDDIWDKEKLYKAVNLLNKENQNIPLLYCSKVKSVDNEMNILSEDTFKNHKVMSIYESLQKSTVPGCVQVFNKKAVEYLKKYNGYMESHDWATYSIVTLFGKVIFDENSYINYRIHGDNTIGIHNFLDDFIAKVNRFFKKSKNARSKFAKDLYNTFNYEINDKILCENIYQLGYYRERTSKKIKLIFNNNYKGIIFKIYVLFNKV